MLGPMALALGTDVDGFASRLGPPTFPLGVIAGVKESVNEDVLPGDDDGLVSVESTQVPGMAGFLLVEAGHSALRRSDTVARHTIFFLRTGRFQSTNRAI